MADDKSKLETIERQINQLVELANKPGNYDYSEYLFGFANGLLLAQSLITGKTPVFLKPPNKFLTDGTESINKRVLPGLTDYHLKKAKKEENK